MPQVLGNEGNDRFRQECIARVTLHDNARRLPRARCHRCKDDPRGRHRNDGPSSFSFIGRGILPVFWVEIGKKGSQSGAHRLRRGFRSSSHRFPCGPIHRLLLSADRFSVGISGIVTISAKDLPGSGSLSACRLQHPQAPDLKGTPSMSRFSQASRRLPGLSPPSGLAARNGVRGYCPSGTGGASPGAVGTQSWNCSPTRTSASACRKRICKAMG